MDLQAEVFKTTVETWRNEVDSYWQRNNYFVTFETAALAGCWYVIEHVHLWTGLAFSLFGLLSAVIWFVTSLAVLHYVRYWWSAVKASEGKLGLSKTELDFASRIPGSGLHPSLWILCIPLTFAAAWLTEMVLTITRLLALNYTFAAAQQKGGPVSAFSFNGFIQCASLLVLAATVFVAYRQLKAATAQARASENQARSSEEMAKASIQQVATMRAQLHASNRPALNATGEYGPNRVNFILRNIGTGPAFNIVAQYISGVRIPLGNLEPGATTEFSFDNHLNMPQKMLGMGQPDTLLPPVQDTPLRLEFDSVTGAHCWTKVTFQVGGDSDGTVEITTEQGINEMPNSGFSADGL